MSKVISIASGKGGVGKSFLSTSLSLSLSHAGFKVLLVDGDLGGANLHNFLGYRIPPIGIYNFLREKKDISEIITTTDIGVDFIAGTGDILGMAHITAIERGRFFDKLKNSQYDYIIMDLGAGTSYNMVDLFNASDYKLIAMNSEPTSIENAYGFLKIAVYRHLERILSYDPSFTYINKRLRSKSASYPDASAIIEDVALLDTAMAASISSFLNSYKVGVVLNLVRFKKELNVFYGFETILNKYLRIVIEKIGFIPYDEKVGESIRIMKPFYINNMGSGTVSCIDEIREVMFTKM